MTRPFRVGDIVRITVGDGDYYHVGTLARLTRPPGPGSYWRGCFEGLGNPPGSFDGDGGDGGDGEWNLIGNRFELATRAERQFNDDGTPIPEAGDIIRCVATEAGLWTEGNRGLLVQWDNDFHAWEVNLTGLDNLKGSHIRIVYLTPVDFVIEQRYEEIEHGA